MDGTIPSANHLPVEQREVEVVHQGRPGEVRLLKPAKLLPRRAIGEHAHHIIQHRRIDKPVNAIKQLVGVRKISVHRNRIVQRLARDGVYNRKSCISRERHLGIAEAVVAEHGRPVLFSSSAQRVIEESRRIRRGPSAPLRDAPRCVEQLSGQNPHLRARRTMNLDLWAPGEVLTEVIDRNVIVEVRHLHRPVSVCDLHWRQPLRPQFTTWTSYYNDRLPGAIVEAAAHPSRGHQPRVPILAPIY
jgi:hypothetical protein